MMDIIIINATIVTVNENREVLHDHGLAIIENRIVDIDRSLSIQSKYSSAKKVIDARHKVVFPGLINLHNHSYQTLLKGLGDDRVLSEWLSQMALPAAENLNEDSTYYGAMSCFVESMRSGVTTLVDMFPSTKNHLCSKVLDAFDDTGIRGFLGLGYMHTGNPDDLEGIENEIKEILEVKRANKAGFMLAPFQVWNNSMESLKMTKRLADEYNLMVTTHVSETDYDKETTMDIHGMTELALLNKCGLLDSSLLLVHCVLVDEEEISMMGRNKVSVIHTPVCNMYLSSGIAPIPDILDADIVIGTATEGAGCNNSNNMIETLKITSLLQKVHTKRADVIEVEKVLEMATIDAAKAIGLDNEIGSIEIGKKADLFIFNPKASLSAMPMFNPVSTLVYSSNHLNVETLIIDGRIVMEDSSIVNINEIELMEKVQETADDLVKRASITNIKTWIS